MRVWGFGLLGKLIGTAGAGDAVGDVVFEDAVEVDEREVEVCFRFEDCGGGGGIECHGIRGMNRWLDAMT